MSQILEFYSWKKILQDTGKAFSTQQRTSSTSKYDISSLFLFLLAFLLSWIRIQPIEIIADPDPHS
jgi:hypothetical protein